MSEMPECLREHVHNSNSELRAAVEKYKSVCYGSSLRHAGLPENGSTTPAIFSESDAVFSE